MSITSVNSKIKTAMKDSFITTKEAQAIVVEAQKGPVTKGELKVVRELFEKGGARPVPPGMMVTLAIPENPNDVTFESGARNVLQTFLMRHEIKAKPVSDQRIAQLAAQVQGLHNKGISFSATMPTLPAGLGLTSVRVLDLPGRGGGTHYNAMLPSGGFGPGPGADPNKASFFYLERFDALGRKGYAGPIDIDSHIPGDGSGWGHGIDKPHGVDGPMIHPPQGNGTIAGTLLKRNGESFLAANGLTFEILAGGAAKDALANARSGDTVQLTGNFDMLTDPSGGPMRRVVETDELAVTVSSLPVDGPHVHPPMGHGSIVGTLVTVGSELFLTTRGLSFEILAGGPAKAALAAARSGDQLQISGEFKMLADPSGGPMRRVLETDDVAPV